MDKALDKLFWAIQEAGEVLKDNKEYKKIQNNYCELHEKLEPQLNDEQKKLLDDMFFETCGLESEAEQAYFIEGFKIGLRFAILAYSE